MEMCDTFRRFQTNDRVTVLTLAVSLSGALDDTPREFYSSLAADFERAVTERLYPRAQAAYRECTDRRKRWRYTPWRAEFLLSACDDKTLELCVRSCEHVHIHEKHTWVGDVIVRRIKI